MEMFSLFKDKAENLYCHGKICSVIYNMDIIFKNIGIKLISVSHGHSLILTNDNTIWGNW